MAKPVGRVHTYSGLGQVSSYSGYDVVDTTPKPNTEKAAREFLEDWFKRDKFDRELYDTFEELGLFGEEDEHAGEPGGSHPVPH
jgi:hypothetical protein